MNQQRTSTSATDMIVHGKKPTNVSVAASDQEGNGEGPVVRFSRNQRAVGVLAVSPIT